MKIVFATNNKHKLEEIKDILGKDFEIVSLAEIGCHEDIPETGLTLEENARQKSTYIVEHYNHDCFADDTGLEVDVIVEHASRWAGIEIKLSDAKVGEGAGSLLRLRDKVLKNPVARTVEPAFLAVIVGKGNLAYRRKDGVYVIPAATLSA